MSDPKDCIEDGTRCAYRETLENALEEIEKLVTTLLVEHMRSKGTDPIDPTYDLIREWLGADDWHVNLSEDDQKIVGTNEGLYQPEWGKGPWNP